MASDQNVALMLMQVLIQHISDEFMAWFHVFFLDDVIEIGQLVGYFEKQAIPRINGYFDITVSTHFDSQFRSHFRMSRETLTVEVLTKIIGNCRYHLHKKNRLGMLLYLKQLLKKQIKIILVHKVFWLEACSFIQNGNVVRLIFCGCAFINANQKSVWLTRRTSPRSWSCSGFLSHSRTFQCRFNGIN